MKDLELEPYDSYYRRDNEVVGYTLKNGYGGFVDSFEVETVAFATTGSYQGDYHWLLYDENNGEYAYLVIGYGSCSGCDMLEAMEGSPAQDFIDERDSFWNSLIWQTWPDMFDWLTAPEREQSFAWSDGDEFAEFIKDALDKLLRHGMAQSW